MTSNLRGMLEIWLREQWLRIAPVPKSEPGSYARGYDNGMGDILRGVRAILDDCSAVETPVKAWGGSDVCHTCAAHCVVIEDMRTALRDIKSFVGTGSYVGQEVALKVARALGEAYSAVETKLHEGYRQSFLKALEYAGASGLLGDGDKSDLLEIYKRLWPQAPADIRTEPFTPKASTNDVLDRNRDERFVGREIAGCSGGRCEVKDGKQLHCAKHWNELPENGKPDV